jgi:hypothetical protein
MKKEIKIYLNDVEISIAEAIALNRIYVDEHGDIYLKQDTMKHVKINNSLYLK